MKMQSTDFIFRAWRQSNNLTQQQAANILGVKIRQVQRWEHHDAPLDRRTIYACLHVAEHPEIIAAAVASLDL